ncbi:MAG: ABC transporter substrate-binding protein [Alphaproteobacteria bacterium]|jgi:branched-chain amino acid transport system substrate-binding protein|nr:ABC transporter substrate-binding protein [Alphaproteobacteria bacterium]
MEQIRKALAAAALAAAVIATMGGPAQAQDDATIKMGLVAFLSGPAAGHFGIPARNGAEMTIDAINNGTLPPPYDSKGIAGRRLEVVSIDESGGATKQVTEFRNLVQRQGVDLVVGYISSGDCLAVPAVAEELKTLTILADCGTPRVFEQASYKYVFRTGPHAVMDNVAAARYLLDRLPNAKRIAGINQNYAWGQDSWQDFSAAMAALQPGTETVSAQFPKIFAGQYGAEISALIVSKPAVVHSSLWGADLEAFIVQGAGRGLFQQSQVILSAGEQILPRIGRQLPDGTIIGGRGPHGPFAPPGPIRDWFRATYKERYNTTPNYAAYKYSQALLGVKAAYEKAAAAAGAFPTQEQVIAAFEFLEWTGPSGPVTMSLGYGHQAAQQNAIGLSKYDEATGEVGVTDVVYYPADCVNPPADMIGLDWIKAGFPGAKCD